MTEHFEDSLLTVVTISEEGERTTRSYTEEEVAAARIRQQEREDNREALNQAAQDALEVNRTQSEQNQAVWDAANEITQDTSISDYNNGNPISVSDLATIQQALRDLFAGLKLIDQRQKSYAEGFKVLVEHDEATKTQLNGLIRLVLGQLDATD